MLQMSRLSALYNVEKCMIGEHLSCPWSLNKKQTKKLISNTILFSIQFQGIHLRKRLQRMLTYLSGTGNSGYISCMILASSEWWMTLSTMQYLPFAEQTLYARICARATSVTFIHPKLTLEYVEDDPAWKYEEFLVRQNNHCKFNSFFETYISIYFVHVLRWTLNILSGRWEYIQGYEAPGVQINGSKAPLARPT